MRSTLKYFFLCLVLATTLWTANAYTSRDNRYCTVLDNESDSVNDYFTLRKFLKKGFSEPNYRACVEKIDFDQDKSFTYKPGSSYTISSPRDQNSDNDEYNFILDGTTARNDVTIYDDNLSRGECVFKVNAPNVQIKGLTIYVREYDKAVCIENEDFEIDLSGVTIIAQDDLDGDKIPSNRDWCPNIRDTTNLDSDEDGWGDKCDNCPFFNTTQRELDKDTDGVGDGCDNCPEVANTDQQDSDGDGRGNACDLCATTESEDNLDTDHDSIGDACDLCPEIASEKIGTQHEDSDGDGRGNECDLCPAVASEDNLDTDEDGIGDACDNCPEVTNTDQEDSDGNAVGNVCQEEPPPEEPPVVDPDAPVDPDDQPEVVVPAEPEEPPLVVTPTDPNDQDGDGIANDVDNCPTLANPGQEDSDGNSDGAGKGDICESSTGNPDGSNDPPLVVDLTSSGACSLATSNAAPMDFVIYLWIFLIPVAWKGLHRTR